MSFFSRSTLAICFLFLFISPSSHATNIGFFQTSSYSMPSPSSNTGGFRFAGGGMIIGMGHGKMTFQTGGAYITQVLNGADSAHLFIPLWLRIRIAQSLFMRLGGNLNYQLDRIIPTVRALDFGVLAGAGLDIPLGRTYGLVVAADYQYSLANLASAGTLNNHQILGWVGLRFGRP